MLKEYLQKISETAQQGDAREESFYPTLKDLLEAFAKSSGKTKARVTVLPKKTEAGNPELRVWDGKQHIIGYIEARKPTEENLKYIENSEQLRRTH